MRSRTHDKQYLNNLNLKKNLCNFFLFHMIMLCFFISRNQIKTELC